MCYQLWLVYTCGNELPSNHHDDKQICDYARAKRLPAQQCPNYNRSYRQMQRPCYIALNLRKDPVSHLVCDRCRPLLGLLAGRDHSSASGGHQQAGFSGDYRHPAHPAEHHPHGVSPEAYARFENWRGGLQPLSVYRSTQEVADAAEARMYWNRGRPPSDGWWSRE